jgi:hypothetical protein
VNKGHGAAHLAMPELSGTQRRPLGKSRSPHRASPDLLACSKAVQLMKPRA